MHGYGGSDQDRDKNNDKEALEDEEEQAFFGRLDDDAVVAEEDATQEANTVHGFNNHNSAVMPWLRRTGIEENTRGLEKDKMRASFVVPTDADSEPELFLMIERASMLNCDF